MSVRTLWYVTVPTGVTESSSNATSVLCRRLASAYERPVEASRQAATPYAVNCWSTDASSGANTREASVAVMSVSGAEGRAGSIRYKRIRSRPRSETTATSAVPPGTAGREADRRC